MTTIRMQTFWFPNCLESDQDRHIVGPDLDPNCLQRLSADDKNATNRLCFIDACVHMDIQQHLVSQFTTFGLLKILSVYARFQGYKTFS